MESEKSTTLYFACQHGASVSVIDTLLVGIQKLSASKHKYGRTPLFHAVSKSAKVDGVRAPN
jgi:hypothetical protein